MTEPSATTRPLEDLPSALDAFDSLRERLDGRRPAIFLDYDGTLTPIVDRPEMAILSDRGRAVVDRLAKALPTAVISGRDRADVERLVGLDSLIYAGSHGFDIRVPGRGEIGSGVGDFTELLDQVEAALATQIGGIDGALIERKAFSIAAHYRLVSDEDYPRFRQGLDRVEAAIDGIKEKSGKKVFEIQPDIDWDKGKCVLALLKALELEGDGVVPMFFGDDVTDEDAFAALQDRGVCVVAAGPEEFGAGRRSAAAFRVDGPDQVLDLLERLADLA